MPMHTSDEAVKETNMRGSDTSGSSSMWRRSEQQRTMAETERGGKRETGVLLHMRRRVRDEHGPRRIRPKRRTGLNMDRHRMS